MDGSNVTRVSRAIASLLRHPQYIPSWISQNFVRETSPLDLELPWFSYTAIDYLQDYIKPDMTVCEFGSGGSSLFFSNRAASVLSVEDSKEWGELLEKKMADKSISNVTVVHAAFNPHKPDEFENSEYMNSINDQEFDVIVVDGTEADVPLRPACFRYAEKHIKTGGIIIVDDSWRYPELRTNNNAKSHRIFQSIGPCRKGVTSTDVYYY